MCTVSYIKHHNGFSLTSNRDEQSNRPTLVPMAYDELDQILVYPKDKIAGGTWIATSYNDISVCLLNGGYKKHKRQLPYARSRGVILKERFKYNNNQNFINQIDLNNVEPFTLLMIDHHNLKNIDFKVLVWDEKQKHISTINTDKNHIWASATLYDKTQREMRQEWFTKFTKLHQSMTSEEIINFHTGSFTNQKSDDMLMQRQGKLKTISVSQINISTNSKHFIYKDLNNQQDFIINLNEICQTV